MLPATRDVEVVLATLEWGTCLAYVLQKTRGPTLEKQHVAGCLGPMEGYVMFRKSLSDSTLKALPSATQEEGEPYMC